MERLGLAKLEEKTTVILLYRNTDPCLLSLQINWWLVPSSI